MKLSALHAALVEQQQQHFIRHKGNIVMSLGTIGF
jgi:hypothetical protein